MPNRTVIITGANRGLGYQTALSLAKNGFEIIMACRNIQASKQAQSELIQISNNVNIHLLELDISNSNSIKAFVTLFHQKFKKINILINNAGIISRYQQKTIDGFDLVIGTNYLGLYLLTKLLLPYFESNADNRIINFTSSIYPMGKYNFSKINSYKWIKAYAVSKYLILLFTFKLAEYLQPRNITVNAVDPGIVRTKIMFTNKWYDSIINFILIPFYVNPDVGSKTISFLATSTDIKGITGQCFYKSKIKNIPKRFKNKKLIESLFQQTDKLLDI
jgi:NAD(P)-dependent dehydrogenase (short-subunit alcohol dehydrogenase family)